MTLAPTIIMGCLAALALLFGFVALLKQKSYVDTKSRKVTAVEVPFFGKLRTNYPALVFVFVGGIFGYLSSKTSIQTSKDYWTATKPMTVDGQLKSDTNIADWSSTEITVIPSSLQFQSVTPQGHFRVELQIPQWQPFNKYLAAVSFQYQTLAGLISPGSANATATCTNMTERLLSCDVTMRKP